MFSDEQNKYVPYLHQRNNSLIHCRFCTELKHYHELIDFTKNREQFELILKIIAFFKIEYLDLFKLTLPNTTCQECYNSFTDAHTFFKKVKQSQADLQDLYNVTIKQETAETDDRRFKPKENREPQLKKNKEICDGASINNTGDFDPKIESPNRSLDISSNIETVIDYEDSADLKLIHECFKDENYKVSRLTTDTDKKYESNNALSTDCGVPIFDNRSELNKVGCTKDTQIFDLTVIEKKEANKKAKKDKSWTSYKWFCHHCSSECDTMDKLRAHSREEHNSCYAFNCTDCNVKFNTFNAFIEHVRQHRDVLRYYCQYCNTKFKSREQCTTHTFKHWKGTQKICDLCGEIFPNDEALERHKKLYKKISLPRRYHNTKPELIAEHENKTWDDYKWTCQDCYLQLRDIHSLREHVQHVHNKCFAMKCMDCLRVMRNYRRFITHVHAHRPYLKNYCQYCNIYFEDTHKLELHLNEHLTGSRKPCHGCGQIFPDNIQMSQHMKQYNAPRCEGGLTTEDLTCDICFKLFKDIVRFRSHRKIHENKNKKCEYTCHTCGKAFLKSYVLATHMKTHSVKSEICQVCSKGFHTTQKLKAHVATHSDLRPFICNECGNTYKTKVRLKQHLVSHTNIKLHKCSFCGKEFKYKDSLKSHEYQHTGVRPYSCQICERTFTNWANCNKHMVRKHGVTLARTKVTAQGKLEINRETGEPKKLASDISAREWLNEMMKPRKRGKKTMKYKTQQ